MNYMTGIFLLCSVCLLVTAVPQEKYNSKYDNFDIDSVLGNERILKNYIKCLMEEGPCTPEGKDFRRILPEALSTRCAKCTGPQKQIFKKMSKYIKEKKPAEWDKLMTKYDPEAKHRETIEKFVSEE